MRPYQHMWYNLLEAILFSWSDKPISFNVSERLRNNLMVKRNMEGFWCIRGRIYSTWPYSGFGRPVWRRKWRQNTFFDQGHNSYQEVEKSKRKLGQFFKAVDKPYKSPAYLSHSCNVHEFGVLLVRHVEGGLEVVNHRGLLVSLGVTADHVEDGVNDLDVQLLGLEGTITKKALVL